MNNEAISIKIYRDGEYSVKDNLKAQAHIYLPRIRNRIDRFFVEHA